MAKKVLGKLTKAKEYFSRKFILAVGTLAFGYHLVLRDKDVEGWAILVGVVLAFYNGSNVMEKVTLARGMRFRSRGSSYDPHDYYNEEGYEDYGYSDRRSTTYPGSNPYGREQRESEHGL